MKTAALIVAAGRGTRAGGGLPKQWRDLAGQMVAEHAIKVFADHPAMSELIILVNPRDLAAGLCPAQPDLKLVPGGDSRSASVRAGLDAVDPRCDYVLIHDGARPCVRRDTIDQVIGALADSPAAAPALPVVDALWTGQDGKVTGTADRTGLYRAQTPQGFHLSAIRAAYLAHPGEAADDVEIARRAGLPVKIVKGCEDNLKITTPADFSRAERIIKERHGY